MSLVKAFGPRRAEKFFSELFSRETLGEDSPLVDITIVPEDNTVERILDLPKLRRLKIVVTRPNPEDLTAEYAAVMEKLKSQNAQKLSQELIKAPKVDRLQPDDDTKKLAFVAATNGYVEGEGKEGKNKIVDSTKLHPKAVPIEVSKDASSIGRFLSAFLRF